MAVETVRLIEQLSKEWLGPTARLKPERSLRSSIYGKVLNVSEGNSVGLQKARGDLKHSGHSTGYQRFRISRSLNRRSRIPRASDGANDASSEVDEATKEELAAKLAEAEAEASALRKELASRRADKIGDLSKLKPGKPEKRIDGTGFRETILGTRGGTGRVDQQMAKWGLSEAEIFAPKEEGTKTVSVDAKSPAFEEGAEATIRRRLIIGLALTAVTIAASLVKLPAQLGKPSKPLFFYLVPLVRLQSKLAALTSEEDITNVEAVTQRLKSAVGPTETLKENLLSAASLFESNQDTATSLTFDILEYLDQADYRRYFENRGQPTATQQAEFLRFSLQSIKAAYTNLGSFLKLAPSEALEAAKLQLSSQFY